MNIYDAHCHMIGEGDPVVILHPFIKEAFAANSVVIQLAQQFRIYSVTLPGLNGIYDDMPRSFEEIQNFFHKLIQNKYLDSFVLIGISIGGAIAIQYSLIHKEKIKKLILISPSGLRSFYPFLRMPLIKSIFISLLRNHFEKKNNFHRFLHQLLFTSKFQIGQYLPADALKKQGEWSKQAAYTIAILAKKYPRIIKQCHIIKKPVLLIGGKNDRLVPPSVLRDLEGRLQSVSLQLIDEAGHLSILENPEFYFIKIEQFI